MKIIATGFGNPDKLEQRPTESRAPARGEVVVRVMAAGVNPVDRKLYASADYTRSHGAPPPEFPLPLGVEAAGVVTAVGAEANGPAGPVQVGDEVIAYRIKGAYADEIVVPAASIVPKPSKQSWEEAGSMMLIGTTAAHTLAAVRARPGQTVLLHGASGGVGLSVVQLARVEGVHIIGTASEKDFQTLREHGATPVRYGDGLEERVRALAPGGIDAAIDVIGTDEAIDVSLALVEDRSRIATIVAFARARQSGFQALGGSPGQDEVGRMIRDNARLRLTALVEAGAFSNKVTRTVPLADAARAHEMLDKKEGGRIVLVPSQGDAV